MFRLGTLRQKRKRINMATTCTLVYEHVDSQSIFRVQMPKSTLNTLYKLSDTQLNKVNMVKVKGHISVDMFKQIVHYLNHKKFSQASLEENLDMLCLLLKLDSDREIISAWFHHCVKLLPDDK